jgi:hypothetical protein
MTSSVDSGRPATRGRGRWGRVASSSHGESDFRLWTGRDSRRRAGNDEALRSGRELNGGVDKGSTAAVFVS